MGKSTLILYSIPFRVNDGKLYTVKKEKCCCLCDVEGAEPQYWDYYDDSVYTVNTLNSTTLVLDNYLFTKKQNLMKMMIQMITVLTAQF